MHFTFVAGNKFDQSMLKDIDTLANSFPEINSVALDNEHQLDLLLTSIGINLPEKRDISDSDFAEYFYDVSNQDIRECSEKEFESFYEDWCSKTSRDNTMDEYGQLMFLQGLSRNWNAKQYRLIINEKA
jgi:hypothetical protein